MIKYTTDTIRNLSISVKDKGDTELNKAYLIDRFDHTALLREGQLQIEIFGDFEFEEDLCDRMLEAYRSDETEFLSGKILYESLVNLSLWEASDIGFWIYLSHSLLYKYILTRWPFPESQTGLISHIKNHFLFENSAQGSLIDHPLSGLWWSFHLSIDVKNTDDKYHLTRIFFRNTAFRTKYLGPSKVARHKEAVLGALEYIKNHVINENKSQEEYGRAIARYLNLIGGTRPLSYFDRNWFYTALRNAKIENYMYQGRSKA